MKRLLLLLLVLTLTVTTLAAAPQTFCKCTCFSNSTIIPLSSYTPPEHASLKRAPTAGCTLCNRAFCLSQRLPICRDAEEKDVLTTCFRRDSQKDQIVVLIFLAGTLGLLGWAGVRNVLERRVRGVGVGGVADRGRGYVAVGAR